MSSPIAIIIGAALIAAAIIFHALMMPGNDGNPLVGAIRTGAALQHDNYGGTPS